jgi:hypothetical protein
VQPVTVQSKAVEKPEKFLGSGFEDFGISEIPLFPAQMTTILNDYVKAAIMLDYNDRDVAAAWY